MSSERTRLECEQRGMEAAEIICKEENEKRGREKHRMVLVEILKIQGAVVF